MTLHTPPPRHETDRLVMRPFADSDWHHYAAYRSRPDVYAFLYATAPTGDALRAKFDRALDARFEADGDAYRLAVALKADGAVVGEVVLKIASRDALQGEVGYVFNPVYAGKGYATEAVTALLQIGFETIGFHRIFARLDSANARSVGVVERLGLRREAHLIQNDRFNGKWGDEYIYAMLQCEWTQRASQGHALRGG